MKDHSSARNTCCASAVLSCLLIAGILAIFLEWPHYRHMFHWRRLDLALWDQALLCWLLLAKTLWLFAPLLAMFGIMCWLGWVRPGLVLLGIGSAAITSWLVADLRVQKVLGNHLANYLQFLTGYRPLEWAGGTSLFDLKSVSILLATVLATTTILLFCLRLGRWLVARWPVCGCRWAQGAALATFCLSAGGALALGSSVENPLQLERLERALPIQLGWFKNDSPAGQLGAFRDQFNRAANQACRPYVSYLQNVQPVDSQSRVEGANLPNVIILVLESFRADAVRPETMPRLANWARRGLRFERHYAGSNVSHFGMFGLLYGRTPLVYFPTLQSHVLPQMPITFRNSGYECSYVSCATLQWGHMDAFINEQVFDRVEVNLNDVWPDGDRMTLRGGVERIIRKHRDRPQFVVAFLMSTHFPYAYPREYEKFLPVTQDFALTRLRANRNQLHNRYRNALLFLDDEISNLIERLDPSRNLIIMTGDHGESFGEDGTLIHTSRGSDVQMQTPLVMVGPNIPQGTVTHFTRHMDVLPTLLHALAGMSVPVEHCHGRDVLAPGFASDSVVLRPADDMAVLLGMLSENGKGHGLVMIRKDRRLRVRLWMHPIVQAEGFVDAHDNWDDAYVPTLEEIADWQNLLVEEMQRLAPVSSRSGVTLR
jgi:arylsulfatase A-like enzyme